jgi:hypothetical protein
MYRPTLAGPLSTIPPGPVRLTGCGLTTVTGPTLSWSDGPATSGASADTTSLSSSEANHRCSGFSPPRRPAIVITLNGDGGVRHVCHSASLNERPVPGVVSLPRR